MREGLRSAPLLCRAPGDQSSAPLLCRGPGHQSPLPSALPHSFFSPTLTRFPLSASTRLTRTGRSPSTCTRRQEKIASLSAQSSRPFSRPTRSVQPLAGACPAALPSFVRLFWPSQPTSDPRPHNQIGGVRFMWENIVDDLKQYEDDDQGFGCILAHAMGLGKTLQVITFVEAFLRATPGTTALIVVPVNTVSTWNSEFCKWYVPPRPRRIPAVALVTVASLPFSDPPQKKSARSSHRFFFRLLFLQRQAVGRHATVAPHCAEHQAQGGPPQDSDQMDERGAPATRCGMRDVMRVTVASSCPPVFSPFFCPQPASLLLPFREACSSLATSSCASSLAATKR